MLFLVELSQKAEHCLMTFADKAPHMESCTPNLQEE
jgi:hypothetical protein